MLTEEQRRAAADALLQAEDTGTPIDPISNTYPDADIEDAYRVSMLVTEAKVARGRLVKGHKIGLTSKAMQRLVGSTEPDFGTLFDNWFVDEGTTLAMSQFNRPLVEVELAFVLGERLVGPGITTADVIRATDFVLPSIEIVDTRYNGRGSKLLVDSISDAAMCGRVILGACPRKLNEFDVRSVGASLVKNGEIEESGVSAAVTGSPVNAVAWLANKLAEFDVVMEPGNVILSGSFIKAIPFTGGDTITASFTGFGDVSFHAA
jgi:2-oxo-hept-3-ene-1,7-dioate hydratase/2-keto-4-pentenoate hydratase